MPSLKTDLYSYQREDANRTLNWYGSGGRGFINVSQMGTGKTPGALAVGQEFKSVLITCPGRLMREWRKEIQTWCPNKTVGMAKKDGSRRFDDLLSGPDYFLVNYESFYVPRHREVLLEYPWDLAIFDEAHKLRNRKALQTEGVLALRALRDNIPMLTMTGSPLVNSPGDLYPLLTIVDQEVYPVQLWYNFIRKYTLFNEVVKHHKRQIIIWGERNTRELKERTDPFTAKRLRKDVLPWLPEKYHRNLILEMEKDHRRLYKQFLRDGAAMTQGGTLIRAQGKLPMITRLRQLSLDPRILGFNIVGTKTKVFMELVHDYCVKGGRKIVAFSTFEEYISLLSQDLHKAGVNHVVYTGQVDPDTAFENKEKFQNDPECMLFLGTTQSAGVGLTLTAASDVVHLDKWWTQDAMDQASDRCCRIGQKNAVQVISLINEDSIDEVVQNSNQRKEKMADSFTDQGVINAVVEYLKDV